MNEKEFEKYASLVLQVGVNLQKGQMVFANCPAEKAELAKIFARRAYELGAGYVKILFNDEKLDRLAYEHAEERILCDVFPSAVLAKEGTALGTDGLSSTAKGYTYTLIDTDSVIDAAALESIDGVIKVRVVK